MNKLFYQLRKFFKDTKENGCLHNDSTFEDTPQGWITKCTYCGKTLNSTKVSNTSFSCVI